MNFPLDLVNDLAVARGGRLDDDPDARLVRRRIASALWLIGVFSIWLLAAWVKVLILGVVGTLALIVALWLFAERPALLATIARYLTRRP